MGAYTNPHSGTFRCPHCDMRTETHVVDSRPTPVGWTRRRRECRLCKKRFSTLEVLEETFINESALGLARQSKRVRNALTVLSDEFLRLHKAATGAAKRGGLFDEAR